MTETRKVRLRDLLLDRRFQVRRALDQGTINRYASIYKNEAPMPPIEVAVVKGVLVVTDGWHRVEALRSLGVAEVEARVEEMTDREALWRAARANLQHGLPLKAAEHRNVFRAYIRARQHLDGRRLKSYREIASDLGGVRSHQTISNWMHRDFPRIAQEMSKEETTGTGGLKETRMKTFRDVVREHLGDASLALRGIESPLERGEMIAEIEEMLQEAKQAAPWEPYEPPF